MCLLSDVKNPSPPPAARPNRDRTATAPRPPITRPSPVALHPSPLQSSDYSMPRAVAQPTGFQAKEHEMDVEKAVTAAGADERRRDDEVEKLLKKVRRYYMFLYFGSMIVAIAPRFAPASRPAFVPHLPAGYDLLVTCAAFAVATLVVQKMLARVLERSPAPPPAPRLTPLAAWPLAILTSMLLAMFFVGYLRFGEDYGYFERSSAEWAAARLAAGANISIAAHTVAKHLKRDAIN